MPNWVRNIVTCSEETMNKIKEKYVIKDSLSFEAIIPMPQSLLIREGNYTEDAIVYALSRKEPEDILEIIKELKNKKTLLGSSYWNKIQQHFNNKKIDLDSLERVAKDYFPDDDEKRLGIKNLEDLGNQYITNILEYGSKSWYDWRIENWGTKWDASRCVLYKNIMIFETAWATPINIFEAISKALPNDKFEVRYADECYSNYNNGRVLFHNGIEEYEDELDIDFAADVWETTIEELDENEDNKKQDTRKVDTQVEVKNDDLDMNYT